MRSRVKALATALVLAFAVPLAGSTFTVTNTSDSGAGSLRQALLNAQNCTGAPHTIAFDVPAGALTNGVAVIAPSSALPPLTCAGTTIDGTTQTANGGNTNNVTLVESNPVGLKDEAVLRHIRRSRFRPVIANGQPEGGAPTPV